MRAQTAPAAPGVDDWLGDGRHAGEPGVLGRTSLVDGPSAAGSRRVPARLVKALKQVVSGQLDRLVTPLGRPEVAGDDRRAVDPAEVFDDERMAGLRLAVGAVGRPEMPRPVLVPGMVGKVGVLVVGRRLDLPQSLLRTSWRASIRRRLLDGRLRSGRRRPRRRMDRLVGSVRRTEHPRRAASRRGDAPPTEADGASGDRAIPIGCR